jgi:hypothetical protein
MDMRSATPEAPRFPQTHCSQCGQAQGPGNSGFSSCESHRIAADLAIDKLKNSGELRRRDDARAMALQLQWGVQ